MQDYKKILSNIQKEHYSPFYLLSGKENYFIDKFSFHDSLSAKANFIHNFLATLPKLIIEWLLILSIVLFIGFVAFDGDNYSYLITTLGIFLAAAFRLMPSVTRLLNAFQGINFYRNVVQ